MSGTRHLRKDQRFLSNTEKMNSSTKYQSEFGSHLFINSLVWYTLREITGKQILVVSQLLVSYPYLLENVALVALSPASLHQRAAIVLTLNELVEQLTHKVVMFGFVDHLDLKSLYKIPKGPNAGTEVVAEAVISLYEGCAEVKAAVKNEWRRTIFLPGSEYKQWPEPFKRATVALAYREVEATLTAATCKRMMSLDHPEWTTLAWWLSYRK